MNDIFTREEILKVKKSLYELPQQIYEARMNSKNFTDLDLYDNQLKEGEAEHIFLIREEKDENGKVKYSNDKFRELRLAQLLSEDDEYQDVLKLKKETEQQKVMAELEVSKLIDTFSAVKKLTELISSIYKEE